MDVNVDVDVECSLLFIANENENEFFFFSNCLQVSISLIPQESPFRAPRQFLNLFQIHLSVCIHLYSVYIKWYSLNRLQFQSIQITRIPVIQNGSVDMPASYLNGKRNLNTLETQPDFITITYCFCLTSNCILTVALSFIVV